MIQKISASSISALNRLEDMEAKPKGDARMFISVFNQGTNISSKLENPTPETIKELMAAFNENTAFFELCAEDGYLT
ncbi:MAG: hypothetical protein DPW16_07880 [Chloroflexi bacterium]|nr:hypothetical protein [Chloroflexota bacterium]